MTEKTRAEQAAKRATEKAALDAFREATKELDAPEPALDIDKETETAKKQPKRKTSATLSGIIAKKKKPAAEVKKSATKTAVLKSVDKAASIVVKPAAGALGALGAYGSDSE